MERVDYSLTVEDVLDGFMMVARAEFPFRRFVRNAVIIYVVLVLVSIALSGGITLLEALLQFVFVGTVQTITYLGGYAVAKRRTRRGSKSMENWLKELFVAWSESHVVFGSDRGYCVFVWPEVSEVRVGRRTVWISHALGNEFIPRGALSETQLADFLHCAEQGGKVPPEPEKPRPALRIVSSRNPNED